MKKLVAIICLCLVLILSESILNGRAYAEQETLHIGCLGPLSGAAAPWGWDLVHGLEMRVDEINDAGGLKVGNQTYKIQMHYYDTKGRADEATTVAKKLIFGDKVKYIIGNPIAATCDAVQLVSEPNKVLFTFVGWGSTLLDPGKPYSFRSMLSTPEIIPTLYDYLRRKLPNVKTFGVINPNDTSGWDVAKGAKLWAEKLGWKVVADVYYERGTKDFGPFVTKILMAKPDMIDFAGAPPGDGGLLAKLCYERGYEGAKAYAAVGNSEPYIKIAGKGAEETYTGNAWDLQGDYVRPGIKDLAKRAKDRYKETPGILVPINYAPAQMIFEAMQKVGSIDVDKVIGYITTHKMETVLGPVVIGGRETYGIDRQFLFPMVANVVRGGKVINLEEILPFQLR